MVSGSASKSGSCCAAHKGVIPRRIRGPRRGQGVGKLRLLAFELVGYMLAAKHGLGVGFDRGPLAGRAGTVKAATTHAGIGVMRRFRLFFK